MTIMPIGMTDTMAPEHKTWQWYQLDDARKVLETLYDATVEPPRGVAPGDHRAYTIELAQQAVAHIGHALTVEGPEDALLAANDVMGHVRFGLQTLRAVPIGQDPTQHPDLVVALERALQRIEDAQRTIDETVIGFG